MTAYQMCTRCIMDTSAQNIKFNAEGHCNFCVDFLAGNNKRRIVPELERNVRLKKLVTEVKRTRGKNYDCLIGVSGGVDSTYAIHLAKQAGMKPLAVHLDNGWNSELATNNIHTALKTLQVDLYTHVIDWEEFKDLQKSFFAADVVDIEVLTDHAILACLHKIAAKQGVSYILTGMNNSTEGMSMPKGWNHFKFDATNIKAIHKRYGKIKSIKTFPLMSLSKYVYYRYIKKIMVIDFLDYFEYSKEEATQLLVEKYGFKKYENKHYENIFTRFNQAYILPKKFGIDKRRLHLSNLICTGQLTRDQALSEIKKPTYPNANLEKEDLEYVLKKLNFTQQEFQSYLDRPSKNHKDYPSDYPLYRKLRRLAYGY